MEWGGRLCFGSRQTTRRLKSAWKRRSDKTKGTGPLLTKMTGQIENNWTCPLCFLPMGSSAPTVLDVLANDSGGTGTLSISSVGTVPYGTVSVQPPQTQGGHQTLLFTPMMGYSGTESFTYTATDNAGDYGTATVSVTVSGGYATSAPQISTLSSHLGSTLGGGTPITINGPPLTNTPIKHPLRPLPDCP